MNIDKEWSELSASPLDNYKLITREQLEKIIRERDDMWTTLLSKLMNDMAQVVKDVANFAVKVRPHGNDSDTNTTTT